LFACLLKRRLEKVSKCPKSFWEEKRESLHKWSANTEILTSNRHISGGKRGRGEGGYINFGRAGGEVDGDTC